MHYFAILLRFDVYELEVLELEVFVSYFASLIKIRWNGNCLFSIKTFSTLFGCDTLLTTYMIKVTRSQDYSSLSVRIYTKMYIINMCVWLCGSSFNDKNNAYT